MPLPRRCGSRTASAISAHCVILATGVAYRQLDVPGAAELTGRGLYYARR